MLNALLARHSNGELFPLLIKGETRHPERKVTLVGAERAEP
jgi:hypothetical protein